MMRKIKDTGVQVYTETRVKSIEDNGVVVTLKDGSEKLIEADTVISAFGLRPLKGFAEAMKKHYGWKVRVIGDNDKVGRIGTAVRGGYFAGTTLDD